MSDVDTGVQDSLTIVLSNPANGTLSGTGQAGITATMPMPGSRSGIWAGQLGTDKEGVMIRNVGIGHDRRRRNDNR